MIAKWLAAHVFRGISPIKKKQLLTACDLDINKINHQLKQWGKLDIKGAEKIVRKTEKIGAEIICYTDPHYPILLREIDDPPLCVFVMGNKMLLLENYIAFVGTRRATSYGCSAASLLIKQLSDYKIGIASGMAEGIDTVSHKAALDSGMPTVAVLGTGIDILYPRSNETLMHQLCEKGIVITECIPGTPPEPFRFPVRNRIISGLSLGVVVVEARERSGSMITHRLALEQNREVFAVPGRLFDKASTSTNRSIKNGESRLVTCGKDIIDEFIGVEILKESDTVIKLECGNLADFLCDSPKSIDEIVDFTGKNRNTVLMELTEMELDGKIMKNTLNQYCMRF